MFYSSPSLSSSEPNGNIDHQQSSSSLLPPDTEAGPVQQAMHLKLTQALQPIYLRITNESYKHNVPRHSETHFQVVVAAPEFETMPHLAARHRRIHAILADELRSPPAGGGVHALSIVAYTPTQWQQQAPGSGPGMIPATPACQGGDGSLPKRVVAPK